MTLNYRARGRKKSEEIQPTLETDIREFVDGQAQAGPQLKSTLTYARMKARDVRAALIEEKDYDESKLPERHTIEAMLSRFGYRLKNIKGKALSEDS